MALLRLAFAPELIRPMLAMVFASVVCVGLVVLRIAWTQKLNYAFLVWNLFLAWVPLVLALYAAEEFRKTQAAKWRFTVLSIGWLLFFPNAFYIFTDIIHLTYTFYRFPCVDLVLILCYSLTGLVVGFVSLYLIQAIVRQLYGPARSWVFVAAV